MFLGREGKRSNEMLYLLSHPKKGMIISKQHIKKTDHELMFVCSKIAKEVYIQI